MTKQQEENIKILLNKLKATKEDLKKGIEWSGGSYNEEEDEFFLTKEQAAMLIGGLSLKIQNEQLRELYRETV